MDQVPQKPNTSKGRNSTAAQSSTPLEDSVSDKDTRIIKAQEDDEDELPWQVIALLDQEILQQLVWAARGRKKRVAQSMAGGTANKPHRYSLEGCYVPGRFLFRVEAQEGAKLYVREKYAYHYA